MKSGASDAARLEALADLLDAGQSPVAALGALSRLGGPVARWARPLEAGVRSMPLGMALAQQRVLTDAELGWVGGAEHAGSAASLRVVATRRRTRQTRGRALWGALLVPGLMILLSAGANRFLLGLLGGVGAGWLGDVLPLVLLVAAVGLGLRHRGWTLDRLGGLPLFGAWIREHRAARAAEALGAALLRVGRPEEAFAAAARLAAAPALGSTADRVKGGTPLAEALPAVPAIGEPLALTLTAGLAAGDLSARLLAFSVATELRLTARLRSLVRILAWTAVVWVNLRGLWAFSSLDWMGSGLPGAGGLVPGVNPKDVDDLMRELDL